MTRPLTFVVPLVGERVASDGTIAAWNVTVWPDRGWPVTSSTLKVSVAAYPLVGITPLAGFTDTYCRLPAWAALTMIIACWVMVPVEVVTVAFTIILPGAVAVNVTDATPFIVEADDAESVPPVPDEIAKATDVPLSTGLFITFRTSAVILVVWPTTRLELTTLRVMEFGSLVMVKLAETGARGLTVALTVTVPEEV